MGRNHFKARYKKKLIMTSISLYSHNQGEKFKTENLEGGGTWVLHDFIRGCWKVDEKFLSADFQHRGLA